MTGPEAVAPRIDVVGLGPAGPELITEESLRLMAGAGTLIFRTRRHPAASVHPEAPTFDDHYEAADTFDQVYRSIAEDLVAGALSDGAVVYAVPGSPTVAEESVALLRRHPLVTGGAVSLEVHPAVSFLDLAFDRMGADPVAAGVRVVDGEAFAVDAAGQRGPLLVAQCWSMSVLSGIKLSVDTAPRRRVSVLHHLGLADERVWEVEWDDLDRTFAPDHLTSLWIPELAAPVAGELVRLDELVHTLRERCPWDRRQTHGSLARHLLEESYEVLEAIDTVSRVDAAEVDAGASGTGAPVVEPGIEERAVAHLEEELGDLLFQVYFHATLAAEAGRFTLADVARGVHDKLVGRHPHVFGDVTAETSDQVAANWEALKLAEKGRASVTEGIPVALPALALATKLQRKALAVGMVLPDVADEAVRLSEGVGRLSSAGGTARGGGDPGGGGSAPDRVTDGEGGGAGNAETIGDLLFSLSSLARVLGVDPENALRARAERFRAEVETLG